MMKHRKFSIVLISLIALMFFLTGCNYTGSLNDKSRGDIIDLLTQEGVIDEVISESVLGRGELEYFTYVYDVKKGDKQFQLSMQQATFTDDYRIFGVYSEDESFGDDLYFRITKDGDVTRADDF